MAKQKTIYEPHPVSPERKAELRKSGLTILDIRFMPENERPAPKANNELTRTDVARMSKTGLVDQLSARGLDVGGSADDMRERLSEALF
jgi:hypothetical protein